MKQLEDMTEPELGALTVGILDGIKAQVPPNTAYVVLFWPPGTHGVAQYGSNCGSRRDMIASLRETADRLERREEVARREFMERN